MKDFFSKEQIIIARGVLINSGRVLVIRNLKDDLALEYYDLPGTHVAFGEDPAQALAEAFFEQTQIPVCVDRPFHTISRAAFDRGKQIIEIVYRVTEEREITQEQGMSLLWIPIGETGYFFSSRIMDAIRASLEG